jgi:hypothetical protein
MALAECGRSGGRAGDGADPLLLVPVPTARGARRRRGDHPLAGLARVVADEYGPADLALAPVLRVRRRVADQAALSAPERAANLHGALAVRTRGQARVLGARCVVVDDVVTTGATLAEAARVLRAAGAAEVVAATVAATARRPVGVLRGSVVLVTPPRFVDYRQDMAGQPPRQTRERRSARHDAGGGTEAGASVDQAPRRGW